jgi:plastocyanin
LRLSRLLIPLAAAALLAPGTAAADNIRLNGTVGPGPSISLTDASGGRVTQLDAGTYDLVVDDKSVEHNFHLFGGSVDVATEVEFVGVRTFTVTLTDGTYQFVCDPHASTMKGSFRVGAASGGGGGGGGGGSPAPKRLTGTVGPGFAISMRTAAGALARLVGTGNYRITIRDRSKSHNFHLVGPGLNKRTGVGYTGTVTWTVRLRPGTYRFVCDPHKARMKGSFRVG